MAKDNSLSEDTLKRLGTAVAYTGSILLLIPLRTLAGALCGWVVGWFLGETILDFASQAGFHNLAVWQLGACLGFIGGFLHTKVSIKKE